MTVPGYHDMLGLACSYRMQTNGESGRFEKIFGVIFCVMSIMIPLYLSLLSLIRLCCWSKYRILKVNLCCTVSFVRNFGNQLVVLFDFYQKNLTIYSPKSKVLLFQVS